VWAETRLKRLAYCGRVMAGSADGSAAGVAVKLTGSGDAARAGFSGLQTCGSTWACPVCSEKIQAVRQREVAEAIRAWQASGGAVLFGTLTMRHNSGHRLSALWDAISPAWNRTTSGAGASWSGGKRTRGDKDRFGIAGMIRLVEVKHGDNGWHPHIHFLMFVRSELTSSDLADLSGRLFSRWETALARRGFSVVLEHGIDLRPVTNGDTALGDYFAKSTYRATTAGAAAYEVTASQSKRAGKGGRSPFDLLADLVRDGDERDLNLWHEWEESSAGRRQLTWSHGFRALLVELGADFDAVEQTDEVVAEEADLDGDVLFVFTAEEWKVGRWAWRRCELLDAAEDGSLYSLLDGVRGAGAVGWSAQRRRERRRAA
jgi:hypothetical protein